MAQHCLHGYTKIPEPKGPRKASSQFLPYWSGEVIHVYPLRHWVWGNRQLGPDYGAIETNSLFMVPDSTVDTAVCGVTCLWWKLSNGLSILAYISSPPPNNQPWKHSVPSPWALKHSVPSQCAKICLPDKRQHSWGNLNLSKVTIIYRVVQYMGHTTLKICLGTYRFCCLSEFHI